MPEVTLTPRVRVSLMCTPSRMPFAARVRLGEAGYRATTACTGAGSIRTATRHRAASQSFACHTQSGRHCKG